MPWSATSNGWWQFMKRAPIERVLSPPCVQRFLLAAGHDQKAKQHWQSLIRRSTPPRSRKIIPPGEADRKNMCHAPAMTQGWVKCVQKTYSAVVGTTPFSASSLDQCSISHKNIDPALACIPALVGVKSRPVSTPSGPYLARSSECHDSFMEPRHKPR